MPSYLPYCGAPPVPGAVSWNLDPVLLSALLLLAAALLLARRSGTGAARQGATALGWAVLVLALVSPLCNLSVALFSARVGQHMLLSLVAAPLLAFGATGGGSGNRWLRPGVAAGAFALALWAWHLPGPYAATFASDRAYWAMHASLFGASLWLWAALWRRAAERPDAAALVALATAVQMGFLGALLTLAPRPLFLAVHGPAVTAPWGLTPLEDQQLGGLLMWVPGGLAFAAVCVLGLGLALRRRPAPLAPAAGAAAPRAAP